MVVAPVIKVMSLLLAASFVLAPTPQPQAGKITNKIEKTIIDKAKQNAPGAPVKKKTPDHWRIQAWTEPPPGRHDPPPKLYKRLEPPQERIGPEIGPFPFRLELSNIR